MNINVNLAPQELVHILADSAADIIVASPEFAPALQDAAAVAIVAASASTAASAAQDQPAASPAADLAPLCIHAAVWTQPGQPLQQPLAPTDPASAPATVPPPSSRLPQVPGWRSCPYPYGPYVRTDITGAPLDPTSAAASAGGSADSATETGQASDEMSAFGGRPEGGSEDGFQMYYTSGTTGRPKGVLLSHRVVVLHAIGTILGECVPVPVFVWGFLARLEVEVLKHAKVVHV